jgi:hypothetical protein
LVSASNKGGKRQCRGSQEGGGSGGSSSRLKTREQSRSLVRVVTAVFMLDAGGRLEQGRACLLKTHAHWHAVMEF